MARSAYSPSPSPSLRSNTPLSDSSTDEDLVPYPEASGDYGPSASRPGSPQTAEASMLGEEREADTMTCQWEDCGKVFSHLPTLIEHIHNGTLPFKYKSGGVRETFGSSVDAVRDNEGQNLSFDWLVRTALRTMCRLYVSASIISQYNWVPEVAGIQTFSLSMVIRLADVNRQVGKTDLLYAPWIISRPHTESVV